MINRIKGTQDFINLELFNFIVAQAKTHLTEYNFQEVATPILEPTELFKRTVGEHTDVVSKEMFTILQHGEHANEEAICLRPEHTAPMMRAYLENDLYHSMPAPWKAFTYGPMFRYERPQKGRFRQFHQISLEIIDSSNISEDVRFISMLDSFFKNKLKLTNYALQLNFLGTPEDRARYRLELVNFLEQINAQICETCRVRKSKNPLRIFDCKSPTCQAAYEAAPVITDALSTESRVEWELLQQQLALLSISFVCKPTLVRGLDYYNKTVFEFVSTDLGAQNSFCGGGRYDQLASLIGAKQDYPSVGAGIGIERLILLLETQASNLNLPTKPALIVILPLTPAQTTMALLLAQELNHKNLCIDLLLEQTSVKSMMRKANRLGAKFALLIGESEQQAHVVTIKNMVNGTEEIIKQVELASYLLHSV